MPSRPDITLNEARLAALRSYDILDTPAEQGFDDIVTLATQVCDVPVALVSFVSFDRQWFKARVGFEPCETDLSRSVCRYVLSEPDVLVIPDLSKDPRTAANPLVTDEPHIRFYAGAPLKARNGQVLGSLCVIDAAPRPEGLTGRQVEVLRSLARQVMLQLELRSSLADRIRAEERLSASEAYWRGLFQRFSEGFIVGELVRDGTGRVVDWRYVDVNAAWGELVGVDPSAAVGRTIREMFPGIEPSSVTEFSQVVETGEGVTVTRQVGTSGRWYEGRAFRLGPERFAVIFLELTERMEADRRVAALLELGDRLRDLNRPIDFAREASRIVGEALGVARAGFGRLDGDDAYVVVEADWTKIGSASVAGRHRFADYGDLRSVILRGEAVTIEDVLADRRTTFEPGPLLRLDIRAMVNVPVRDRGRTVAIFFVHDDRPRDWSSETLAFLRNVADRVETGLARLRAEADQRVLNEELSHRMKNTFAMVQAIASQTLKGVSEKEAVNAFTQRIHAFSRAHEVLLLKNWAAAPVREVITSVLSSFGQERFDLSGPDVPLGPRATLSFSLVLHELTTNAVKYGALSAESGRVSVRWEIEGVDADTFVLRWAETGGPAVSEPSRRGFGSRLIKAGLVGTGGVTFRYLPEGLHVDMRAPIDQVGQS